MHPLNRIIRFGKDKRGIAATEFALIAPALIFLVMGVLEMSFRFRASEEATRYVHQVADLISREEALTNTTLQDIYDASVHMMKPLDTVANLDLDISSITFVGTVKTPTIAWRRTSGASVNFNVAEAAGMGAQNETVIRVGIRYRYDSVVSSLFGGGALNIERSAFARPREERILKINGVANDGGSAVSFAG